MQGIGDNLRYRRPEISGVLSNTSFFDVGVALFHVVILHDPPLFREHRRALMQRPEGPKSTSTEVSSGAVGLPFFAASRTVARILCWPLSNDASAHRSTRETLSTGLADRRGDDRRCGHQEPSRPGAEPPMGRRSEPRQRAVRWLAF